MSISPKGDRIYLTARNNNAVLEFDTSKLVTDGAHAMVGIAPVGDAPVPVMVVDKGRKVVVGNSNRFAGRGEPQSLIVLDAAKIQDGKTAVMGTIPAGAFPREMAVSSDRRTLFLTNFGSNSLQVMDIAQLPIDPKIPPEIATNAEALAHRHDYQPVIVDPNVLKRYVGVYRSEGGAVPASIDVNGDRLMARLSNGFAQNALPESDAKFYAMGAEIEFPKVAEGGYAGQLILRQGQRETVLKRLDEVAAKPFLDAAAAFEKRMKDNKPQPGSEVALRKLIADLQAGKPDESMLVPCPVWQQSLTQLQSQASQMGEVKSIKFQAVGGGGPDIYMVESEKGTWMARIWMSADGKVERAAINGPMQQ